MTIVQKGALREGIEIIVETKRIIFCDATGQILFSKLSSEAEMSEADKQS